ncbi:MAG: bifunctional metallophosphatase/5'-nucleotidase, partial [Bacteroidaceae bacterium]|nr:bifunctional metallophosphatase/5'-nucleotidase [Bacteroidaceae bacterium]
MKKLLGFLFFLSICLGTLQAQETTLAIYSTNDVHGHLTNFAKIARYIKKDRINYTHTLVLSGGDVFTGNPIVDQYPQRGLPMIDLMNQTGYQYAVFGNHEFDYGLEALTNCIKNAHFELICANVKSNNPSFNQPKPYVIFRKGEIRICILGLVETTKQFQGKPIPSAHPDRLKGLSFTPPFEAALTYKHLRQECDLFIGLFHTGYDTDKKIAQAMP